MTLAARSASSWQLNVRPALQSCGIGTLLIRSAEQRISARGLTRAELGGQPPITRLSPTS